MIYIGYAILDANMINIGTSKKADRKICGGWGTGHRERGNGVEEG